MKRIFYIFSVVILCQYNGLCADFVRAANSGVAGNMRAVSELVKPDGTLNTRTGYSGSLNISGFSVKMDAKRGVILSATGVAPSPPPLNGWSGVGNVDKEVYALAMDGSGNVYAGGFFHGYVAKWDGSNWTTLSGLNGFVDALAISGTTVYAGGGFADGGVLNYVAQWNGSWSGLGSGVNNAVASLLVVGSDVYAGGYMTGIFGSSSTPGMNYIAHWNGTSWNAMDQGFNNTVFALAINGGSIYAGGYFNYVGAGGGGSGNVNFIARWDGSYWERVGYGLSSSVLSIVFDGNGNLYAGGQFQTSYYYNIPLNNIGMWDGNNWNALGTGLNGLVRSIYLSGGTVYAGGSFTGIAGDNSGTSGLNYIAAWDGNSWLRLDQGLAPVYNVPYSDVLAIIGANGGIYAGGSLSGAINGATFNELGFWSGQLQSALPVELVTFGAKRSGNSNILNWTTATEKNNSLFKVERAGTDLVFGVIGQVKGNGTTNALTDYVFEDKSPLKGVNYYRLLQVDYDGTERYSNTVFVFVRDGSKGLLVYPTMVNGGVVNIVSGADEMVYSIFNLLGQPVLSGVTNQRIDVSDLPKGPYIIRVGEEEGKFIK